MGVRLLTEETIGKIAAGEVVERPASVAKELLENALDAGAGRVRVAVRGGGAELIEVADDGRGMAAAELPLALRRHATSKLAAFEDLDRLATLGFRGEVLSSIAAVSDFALRSRPAGAAHGTELRVAFGAARSARPTAAPVGTTAAARLSRARGRWRASLATGGRARGNRPGPAAWAPWAGARRPACPRRRRRW